MKRMLLVFVPCVPLKTRPTPAIIWGFEPDFLSMPTSHIQHVRCFHSGLTFPLRLRISCTRRASSSNFLANSPCSLFLLSRTWNR